jgi:hypothetical protein
MADTTTPPPAGAPSSSAAGSPARPNLAIAQLLTALDAAAQASGLDEATLVQMLSEFQAVIKRHTPKPAGK